MCQVLLQVLGGNSETDGWPCLNEGYILSGHTKQEINQKTEK